jgi:multidrug efflux pump subunit AcrA (membrane-fusion protein)
MLADVYEYEMAWVQVGQEVEITSPAYPGRVFPGEISFIEPSLNPETRSVTVRVEVPNPNMELRPEMFVEARIHIPLDRSNQVLARMAAGAAARFSSSESMNQRVNESTLLAIPDLAVLRTGERELVYVELEPGTYVQREVITGPTGEMTMGGMRETYVPVLAGLRSGERVVTRGNFLIDSQTTLTGSASAAYGSALDTQPSSSSGAEPSPMPGMSH